MRPLAGSLEPSQIPLIRAAVHHLASLTTGHPDNNEKLRKIAIIFSADHRTSLGVVGWLSIPEPSYWKDLHVQSGYLAIHNTTYHTGPECLREGIARPSAVGMKHPEWHGTATFYARAAPLSSFSQSSYSDKFREVIKRASKYTNFQSVRSTSLLPHCVSRQASHRVVKAGGVQADHAASLY